LQPPAAGCARMPNAASGNARYAQGCTSIAIPTRPSTTWLTRTGNPTRNSQKPSAFGRPMSLVALAVATRGTPNHLSGTRPMRGTHRQHRLRRRQPKSPRSRNLAAATVRPIGATARAAKTTPMIERGPPGRGAGDLSAFGGAVEACVRGLVVRDSVGSGGRSGR